MITIAVITDIHLVAGLPASAAGRLLDLAVTQVEASRPDAVVVLGDLSDDGRDDSLDHVLERLGALGPPVYLVAGNHDHAVRSDALSARVGRSASANLRMADEGATDLQGVVLLGQAIVMDPGQRGARGAPSWDPTELDTGPALVLSHYPYAPVGPREVNGYRMHLDDGGDWLHALSERGAPTIILAGHVHGVRHVLHVGDALQISNGSLVDPPHDVTRVSLAVRDGDTTVLIDSTPVDGDAPRTIKTYGHSSGGWYEITE